MHYSIRRAQYLHALFIVTMIAMILLGFLQAWQKNNTILSFDQSLTTLTEYQYLFDTEIIAPANLNNSDFVTSDFNQAPVRYGKLNQWFKIDITNTQPTFQQLTLILDNPMSDSLTLYQKENNEYKKIATYGDKVKGVEKTQRVLPHYSFQLDTGKTKTYLIHNQNTSAPFLPIIVIPTEDFISYEKTLHLIWGTFIGVILLMSAYNLVLYLGVGDRAYFSYICYILSLLMMLGVVHGYGYYVFPESLQLWLSDKVIFLDFCVAYFTLMFALHFLRFTKQDGAIFQVTHFFSYALVALAVFSLFTPEYLSAQVFSVAQTFTYIMTFWLIYLKVRQNFRWTKYYILSWIPFFIGAAIGFLLFSGVIHYSFFTRHALMFSVIFEMAFISMALADRLGDTERRRLYQATHDFKLGFANESLLEDTILKVASAPESANFTLITIEISNYDAVIPYIEEEKFSRLIIQMAKSFEHQLSNHLQLVQIDPHDKKNSYIALIRGEILCFLVQDNNIFSIKSTLKKISNSDNYNPLQKEIPYRIHCVFGAAVFDEHRTNA